MAKTYDSGALPRAIHARAKFDDIYAPDIQAMIPKQGVVMDIGTGVGRDAVAIHNRGGGRLLVIGIDPDEANYHEAVATYPDNEFVLCRTWDDVAKVQPGRQIAYLVREVQDLEEPPSKLKADFINCFAVLMFIPAEEQEIFLRKLHTLSQPARDTLMRYRTVKLKEGMVKIDETGFRQQAQAADFVLEDLPDVPDPPPFNRGFQWKQYRLTASA